MFCAWRFTLMKLSFLALKSLEPEVKCKEKKTSVSNRRCSWCWDTHFIPLRTKHSDLQELGQRGRGQDFISLGLHNGHLVFRCASRVNLQERVPKCSPWCCVCWSDASPSDFHTATSWAAERLRSCHRRQSMMASGTRSQRSGMWAGDEALWFEASSGLLYSFKAFVGLVVCERTWWKKNPSFTSFGSFTFHKKRAVSRN